MVIRYLTVLQAEAVYQQELVHDFPPEECKPFAVIREMLSQGRYLCTGLYKDKKLLSYAFFAKPEGGSASYLLLDYFAVLRQFRGHGIGSAYLRRLPELFPDTDTVLIEAENPEKAGDDAEKAVRARRITFYLRCGCTDSGMTADVFDVPYCVLQLPLRCAYGADRLRAAYVNIYKAMLAPQFYRTRFRIAEAPEPGTVQLIPAVPADAAEIHAVQKTAFLPLYLRYQDHDTNPAAEPVSKVQERLAAPETDYFWIRSGSLNVGTVRVVRGTQQQDGTVYRISPLCVLPAYQNRGIAQTVMKMLFERYPDAALWTLSTIKEETGNCRLYEKCGFVRTGEETALYENMTLICYEKRMQR